MIDASEALQYMAAVLNDYSKRNKELEADALADRLELSGAVSLLKTMKAENARLREAGNKMAHFISTWHDSLAGVQMTDEDFDEDCGLSDWLRKGGHF